MHRVLVASSSLTPEAEDCLVQANCEIIHRRLYWLSEDERCQHIGGVDAVIAGGEPWTERMIALAAPSLRIIARSGAGYEEIDIDVAGRHGVWVTNTPNAMGSAVADWTIALILNLLRKIPTMIEQLKAGNWQEIEGRELGSMVLGVIGTGHIGREVIKRAHAFGTHVLAYDIIENKEFAKTFKVEYVSLENLLCHSDVITIHCPFNEKTNGLINEKTLNLMKKSAYIINTARPGVIVKDDLLKALRDERIAGAAIDVHHPKPMARDDPYLSLDNVIATPWNAYNTAEAGAIRAITTSEQVVAVLQGGVPRFAVNKPVARDVDVNE